MFCNDPLKSQPLCAGADLAYNLPICDVQPLGFLPSSDDFGHYVVICLAHDTLTVVPINPSPGMTVAHLVRSVSAVIAPIHGKYRRGSDSSG